EIFFTPLHACCVTSNGAGILLCGDSGAGKSTLAYACNRRGWALVSDESTHLAPPPSRVVTGGRTFIRLRADARDLFPELAGLPATVAPNGKPSLDVNAAQLGFRVATSAVVSQCVFLSRRAGPPCIEQFAAEKALAYFLKYLEPRDTVRHE